MLKYFIYLALSVIPLSVGSQTPSSAEILRWEKQAARITIIRDHYGVPHIYGKTDADAVFGLLYAQCEDDFPRVEMNYIEKLGRLAEVKGKSELYNDLLIRLQIDSVAAQADFEKCTPEMQKLMRAFADGVNYYLYKHPGTHPALIRRFKSWYPLLWTDGSIGAISTGGLKDEELKNFYSGDPLSYTTPKEKDEVVTGSNGFAFGPKVTASGHSILYINPHVTFYFRPEVQMISEEGLNAYGAVTWGQFFVYQGFNEHCGWMHTSGYSDVSDLYIEKLAQQNGKWTYEYDGQKIPVRQKAIRLKYLNNGKLQTKTIEAMFTRHGPIMAKRDGQYLSLKAHNRDRKSLVQSWMRTKAQSFAEFKQTMDLKANTSNNTVYADAEGNIAYWHGNFLPVRDPHLDWSKPVDGSTSKTAWKGLHPVSESVHSYNPPNGWLQNCNSSPFTVAGANSPKKENYPRYMAPDYENFRGVNAVRIFNGVENMTLDKTIEKGYDTYLAAFQVMMPPLVAAFEKNVAPGDSLYDRLKEPIAVLKAWDFRCGESSIATALAVEWGQRILPVIMKVNLDDAEAAGQVEKTAYFMKTAKSAELLTPLAAAVAGIEKRAGSWKTTWGDLNRFQRIDDQIDQRFDDAQPSIPVAFTSSTWGMLPSYNSRYYPGTNKRYGVNGNSFICAVEFGKRIKAKSLLAGGESGHVDSPHFKDQAENYAHGKFKDVLFYRADVEKNAERTYRPGE